MQLRGGNRRRAGPGPPGARRAPRREGVRTRRDRHRDVLALGLGTRASQPLPMGGSMTMTTPTTRHKVYVEGPDGVRVPFAALPLSDEQPAVRLYDPSV